MWICVDRPLFKKVYDARLRHMRAKEKLLENVSNMGNIQDPIVAFAFWHNLDGGSELPLLLHQSLGTAVTNAGFSRVCLLSYQPLVRLPHGVELHDASKFLPQHSFQAMLEGLSLSMGHKGIALVSDFIRMIACGSLQEGTAAFIDVDTLWLRNSRIAGTGAFGHMFASHRTNPRSRLNANPRLKAMQGISLYGREPNDGLKILPPFFFTYDSEIVVASIAVIEQEISKLIAAPNPEAKYELLMTAVLGVINDCGMRDAIVDARTFSPIDYWETNVMSGIPKSKRLQRLFEHGCPVAVNCFAQSTCLPGGSAVRATVAADDSLWSHLFSIASKPAICVADVSQVEPFVGTANRPKRCRIICKIAVSPWPAVLRDTRVFFNACDVLAMFAVCKVARFGFPAEMFICIRNRFTCLRSLWSPRVGRMLSNAGMSNHVKLDVMACCYNGMQDVQWRLHKSNYDNAELLVDALLWYGVSLASRVSAFHRECIDEFLNLKHEGNLVAFNNAVALFAFSGSGKFHNSDMGL